MAEPAATLTLQYPIELKNGERIETLEFRRVKARDIREAPAGEIRAMFHFLIRCTGQPPSIIDELDTEDMKKASEIVQGFLPEPPETGDKSSDGSLIE